MAKIRSRPANLLSLLLAAFLAVGCDKGDEAGKRAAEQKAKAQQLWQSLSHCLIGPALEEGEAASGRMRNCELTVAVSGAAEGWPRICDAPLAALLDHVEEITRDPGAESFEALGAALRTLKGTTPLMYLAGDEPAVDKLWAAAGALELVQPSEAGAESPKRLAPEAAAPATADMLVELGTTKGLTERVEVAPGAAVRFMYGSGKEGAFLCKLDSRDGPLAAISCSPLKREVSLVAWPLSSSSDEHSYYWDPKPKPAAWPLEGDPIEAPFTETAYVFGPGAIIDVVRTRLGPSLVRANGRRGAMKGPAGARWLGFRAGAVVWRGPRSGPADVRPMVVYDARGDAPVSRAVKVGSAPRDVEHLEACRSGDTLVVALLGSDPKKKDEDADRGAAMLFRQGDEWHKVVSARIRLGAKPYPWTDRGWRSMTCSAGAAAVTWLRSDNAVGQLRCTPKGCESGVSAPLPLNDADKVRVATLGDKVLVLRAAKAPVPINSVTEVITMRLGPLKGLAESPERPLVGDGKHGGLAQLHRSIGLVASDGAAVALIRSGDKVHAVRIDASGKIGALTKR